MCIETKQRKPSVARRDITVYKVLRRSPSGGFESEYQHFRYTRNKHYELCSQLKVVDGMVDAGFHSYKYLRDARRFSNASSSLYVYEFTIPKGAKYFKGSYVGCICYTSDQIVSGDLTPC